MWPDRDTLLLGPPPDAAAEALPGLGDLVEQGTAVLERQRHNAAGHVHLVAERQHPGGDTIPLGEALGGQLVPDLDRLAATDQVAGEEGLPG